MPASHSAVAHLDKLHAKHILPGFKDRTAEEREIESLATDITRVRSPRRFGATLVVALSLRLSSTSTGLSLDPEVHSPDRRDVQVAPYDRPSERGEAR